MSTRDYLSMVRRPENFGQALALGVVNAAGPMADYLTQMQHMRYNQQVSNVMNTSQLRNDALRGRLLEAQIAKALRPGELDEKDYWNRYLQGEDVPVRMQNIFDAKYRDLTDSGSGLPNFSNPGQVLLYNAQHPDRVTPAALNLAQSMYDRGEEVPDFLGQATKGYEDYLGKHYLNEKRFYGLPRNQKWVQFEDAWGNPQYKLVPDTSIPYGDPLEADAWFGQVVRDDILRDLGPRAADSVQARFLGEPWPPPDTTGMGSPGYSGVGSNSDRDMLAELLGRGKGTRGPAMMSMRGGQVYGAPSSGLSESDVRAAMRSTEFEDEARRVAESTPGFDTLSPEDQRRLIFLLAIEMASGDTADVNR